MSGGSASRALARPCWSGCYHTCDTDLGRWMMGSPTSRRKDAILVWPGQPTGSGPITHFWTAIADVLQRLCDGASWPEGADTIVGEDDIAVLCRPCREIYLEDRLSGLMVLEFSLDALTLTNGVGTPKNGVDTPKNGVTYPYEAIAVPRVSMSTFARLYAARGAGQLALVRRAKLQLIRPDITGGGFYSALRQFLGANHWRTGDASYLENGALDRFLASQKDNKKPHYRDIVNYYIECQGRREIRPCGGAKVYHLSGDVQRKCPPTTGVVGSP